MVEIKGVVFPKTGHVSGYYSEDKLIVSSLGTFVVSLADTDRGYYFRIDVTPHCDAENPNLSVRHYNFIVDAMLQAALCEKKRLGSGDDPPVV